MWGGARGGLVLDILGLHAGPMGHIAPLERRNFGSGKDTEALFGPHAEPLLANIAVPADGKTMLDGIVGDGEEFIESDIVAGVVAPVVGTLDSKSLIKWLVEESCDLNVIVGIEAGALVETFGSVFFAIICEFGRGYAEINIVNGLDGFESQKLIRAVALEAGAGGGGFNHGIGHGAELGMVGKGVAVHHAGSHALFGNEAIIIHDMKEVAKASALRKTDVAVSADGSHGPIEIVVVGIEHFGEIIYAFAHAKQFGFDKGGAAVVPAGAGFGLIFNRGDR